MINRPICEEFQQRDKMSDKNPVRSAVSRMFLVTILIFIFVVIIMDSAVAQSQVRSDMIEVTAAVPKDFPPYYFVDESGRPKGFAIDVMDRIAEMVGLRVTYLVENSWADAAEAVKSGRADLIPNIGITANRKAYFDYTAPVETFAISIFVRKETNYIKGVDDLAGHKVAAIKYNIAVILLQDHEGVDLEVFNDPREAVFELLSGHVDAVVYPAPVLMKIVREAKVDHSIKIVGKPLKEIKRAIAVSKGNMNLLDRLNGAVNRFVGTNDYQHIYLKWFGKPQPFWTISMVVLAMSGLFLILFTAMALWRYNSIIKLNRELLLNIADRKRAQERIVQLNAVLQAIRNVNQLITKVKDRERLLQGACDNLIKTRGYNSAWIALIEGDGRFITAAQAGAGDGFPAMVDGLKRGELTRCMHLAVDQSGVLVVADPAVECGDCPLVGIYAGKARLIARLKHEGRIYGFISVTVFVGMDVDEEERRLFEELAGDIAFALHNMELEKKHKRVDEELRESEEKFDTMLRSIGDHMSMMDKDLNIIWANEIAKKIFGNNIIGKKCYEVYHKRKKPCEPYPCLTLKSFQDGKIHEHDTQVIDKDGKIVYFHWTANVALRDKDGKPVGVIEISRDITEHKQAEEALDRSRTLLNATGRMAKVGGWELDAETLDLRWTEETYRIHEVPLDCKPPLDKAINFYHPEDRPKLEHAIQRALEHGAPYDMELRFITAKGKHLWTHSICKPRIVDGKTVKLIGTFQDITEFKKLEAQFRQAQKMEAIGTLAGGVAHDFNNILTVIIGNAQLALMDVIKDESLRIGIEEIKKAGDRAASLTRQLLAFSRKQVIQPEVLDINELLTGIEKMLGRLIAEDVELLTIPEPALWQVEVDPGQMEQVIMNLAVNARDAMSTCADSAAGMPTGGKLTIETANIDLAENYFHEHDIKNEPGSYVMLAVGDTGCGMDEKIKEHIFEPFFTTKEVGKGTGLGLSTVYGIVKQNNGFIWVYSEPGQGTTFKVYLPAIASAQARRAGLPRAKGDTDLEEKQRLPVIELDGSETILIVEDDDGLRKFAKNVLEQHGYKVLDAENGEDALRVSKEHEGPIDLMITDVVMPKMGGKEAAKRLQPLYPQMKVIYMSGYTDNAIVKYGILAPGLNFLQKPFTPESLARKVREMLDE